jgi:transposase
MRKDSATKEYTRRRLAQGKTIRDIKRCLKRYIARQLFCDTRSPNMSRSQLGRIRA